MDLLCWCRCRKKQGRRMPGIENCLKILLTHSQCCPPLHCPLPPRRQSAETYKNSQVQSWTMVHTWGVMRGVETQKLKERSRGKTVSKGFKSSMVTISFLPKLACLLSEKNHNYWNSQTLNIAQNYMQIWCFTWFRNILGRLAAFDCSYYTQSP